MRFPAVRTRSAPARVVVTGMGMVTALGANWSTNATAFREGRKGFGPVTLFDVARQRVQVAAEACLASELPDGCRDRLGRRRAARLGRAARLALQAAAEARERARLGDAARMPLVLGTTSGQMALGEAFFRQAVALSSRCGQLTRCLGYQPQTQALDVQEALGWTGPITLIANACASGANAVGQGWELIRQGQAERVMAGGYEALSHLVFAGFDALQALSPTSCRPFDARRDGLALGDGAAVFVLEDLQAAERRGADIHAEIVGYGAATDLHHLTQPEPSGAAALAAMRTACQVAGVEPSAVGYLNAHGTGTPANDGAEATAIMHWAGDHAPCLAVSSTKASVGHLLGAAGAVEFGICLMALSERWLPPMPGTDVLDPACGFHVVRAPESKTLDYAMTNSFGFGGANASLLLRRWT